MPILNINVTADERDALAWASKDLTVLQFVQELISRVAKSHAEERKRVEETKLEAKRARVDPATALQIDAIREQARADVKALLDAVIEEDPPDAVVEVETERERK